MSPKSWLLLLSTLALVSCSSRTELIVVIDSDLAQPSELDSIRLELVTPSGDMPSTTQRLGGADDPELPSTLTVLPVSGSLGPLRVRAIGSLDGAVIAEQSAVVTLVSGRSTTVRLFLSAACRGVECGEGATCRCGGCAAEAVAVDDWTGTATGGDPCAATDGGDVDAATPDAGGPECASDFECDDGVDCTVESCSAGACSNTPTDSLCAEQADGVCDAVNGCQYGACDPATCVGGACQTAQCEGDVCVRESTCGSGETCCNSECVAQGCDDGVDCTADSCGLDGCVHEPQNLACDDSNPCTDNICDATAGCMYPANSATCDDGMFCNGQDTCADSSCSQHAGNPCPAGSSMCVEADATCRCAADDECPADVFGGWSACDFGANACTTSGTMTRTRTSYSCMSGSCVSSTMDESDSCTRPSTDGTTCGTPVDGTPTACDWSDACDQISQRSIPRTLRVCSGGSCTNQLTNVPEACNRTTNGTSCNDGQFCNGADTCGSGTCSNHAGANCGAGVSCDEGADRCECGRYGEPCCGSSCTQGACLAGTCAALGGFYALQGEDSTECVPNPLTGACSCPAGFVSERIGDLDGDSDEGVGWETYIHHCRAPADIPGADYHGGWGSILGAPPGTCAAECPYPNAFTSGCNCPSGSLVDLIDGRHVQSGLNDCRRQMGICRNTGVPSLTYGGYYTEIYQTTSVCGEIPTSQRCIPNPQTGVCGCPGGFSAMTCDLRAPHTDPVRQNEGWHCDANLTLCVRNPP